MTKLTATDIHINGKRVCLCVWGQLRFRLIVADCVIKEKEVRNLGTDDKSLGPA